MNLLQMSLYGSVLILVITVLRALTLHRFPKKIFLVLWGFVLLRLLIPYTISSEFSLYHMLSNQSPIKEAFIGTEIFQPISDSHVLSENRSEVVIPVPGTNERNEEGIPWSAFPYDTTLSIIWCIGASSLGLYFAVSYFTYYKKFAAAIPIASEHLHNCMLDFSPKRRFSIKSSEYIASPLTYGILKPVILLPKGTDLSDEDTLQYILAHEYMHIRHRDALTKMVTTAALCLHWFNPLVWLMFTLMNRDMERSCDESVLRHLGENRKASYAKALINLEVTKSGLTPLFNHFSKNTMEERITAIMKIRKLSPITIIPAILLTFGVVILFATAAPDYQAAPALNVQNNPNAPDIYVNPKIWQYKELTWQEFQKQTNESAELYHANFYTSGLPDFDASVVFLASKFDDTLAAVVLSEDDQIVRVEGALGELLTGLTEEFSFDDFLKAITWQNGISPVHQISGGAGTAYYIADHYAEITFDSDGDLKNDMLLQISLEHSENITPNSYAWLIFDVQ